MLFTKMRGRTMQHSVLVGLVCLAIASGISCSIVESSNSITMCLESERDALLQFKQGLVDESNALASWKTEKDCCKWRGIACNNQTGHVITLNLSSTVLGGEISPSLLELKNLNYLDLSNNDFGGVIIPKFIGSLSQLKELKLVQANFSGNVPAQLGNLSNLHTLDLSLNNGVSSENFEWLSHLSSLTYLDMSGLDFSKVLNWPQSLSKLTSLNELLLSGCNLPNVNIKLLSSLINSSTSLQLLDLSSNNLNSTSIFYWIANISTNIVHIDLSANELEGPIPDVFSSMLSLVTLDLSYNQLLEGGIPKGFENLCSLAFLGLRINQCSGNIEDTIKVLSCAKNTLETLDLGYNQFWGSIPELAGFSKLRFFDLSENNITGPLLQSVGNLSRLEQLNLNENSMSGVITESHFRNLSRLQSLELSGNHFSFNLSTDWNPPFQLNVSLGMSQASSSELGPAFPKWILTQTNIQVLLLSNAGISGSLPHKILDLFPRLFWVDLSMNQIGGKLPNLSSTSLLSVNLSSNLFFGAVPLVTPRLITLDLSSNMFSGTLSSLCSTSLQDQYLSGLEITLKYVDFSDNLLKGELPNCWMQFQNLYSLNLGRNKFSGNIPSSLGKIKKLAVLRLHQNNFTGEIPSLENCTRLAMVDLGNNNLSGKIPTWIGCLQSLLVLRLRSNQFHGVIPFSLCNLTIIHVLDLSHNNMSGALPPCFNNITALADGTSGSIIGQVTLIEAPLEVVLIWKGIEIEFGKNLAGVRSIDMSSNCFVGEIPQSIASMTELKSLNLSRNHLTGKLPEDFGNMKMLESLDLSRNNLSGNIPASFSRLNYLGVLDVSHNRLSGRIPEGTQLQSFNASAYTGNLGLCGPPLTPNCSGNETTRADDNKEHDNDGLISLGFFISAALGFIGGFWIVCGSLLLKSSWRYAYFKLLDDSRDWIYVKMAVYKAKMQRRLQ